MSIHVITTGGTIDKVYFDATSEYEVGEPQILEIFREANITFDFTVESVLRKDSLEITDEDRSRIRQRVVAAECPRILITHGTDSMVKTAQALTGIPGKTIVLTGSMQPARFRTTDAIFNVGSAVGALKALPPGVYIAINGEVFRPENCHKNHRAKRFEVVS
jgi:L-asparaginase